MKQTTDPNKLPARKEDIDYVHPPAAPGVYRPWKPRTQNQVEVTFYCQPDRIQDIMSYRHVFGDRDFTKSLSRFLTAGVEWMREHHHEVHAAGILQKQLVNLEIDRQEMLGAYQFLMEEVCRLEARRKQLWWVRLLSWRPWRR